EEPAEEEEQAAAEAESSDEDAASDDEQAEEDAGPPVHEETRIEDGDGVPVRRWTEGTRPNISRAAAALSPRKRPPPPVEEPPPDEEEVAAEEEEPGNVVAESWNEDDAAELDEHTTMAPSVDDEEADVTDPTRVRDNGLRERRGHTTRPDETRVEISSSRLRAPPLPGDGTNRVATLADRERLSTRSDFLDEDDAPTQASSRRPGADDDEDEPVRRRSVLPERQRTRMETLPPATPRSRIPDPVESTRVDLKQPPRKPSR
ncbi:MAG: hypothetical protein AB2A00_41495, partial [Myxococcota bacterium]